MFCPKNVWDFHTSSKHTNLAICYFCLGLFFDLVLLLLGSSLFSVSVQNLIMEQLSLRFPHLASNIFEHLDTQSLVNCRETSQILDNLYGNEKLFWLRIIHKYKGNFVQFKETWNKTLKKTPIIHVKKLALATHIFFDKNYSRFAKQWHPLHIAAEQGLCELFKYVSEKTDEQNPKDFEGLTALHLAAQEGHIDVCKFIIEKVEEKNPRNNAGITPLHRAAQCGHFKVGKFIIKCLNNRNPKDNNDMTPLHYAAYRGHLDICEMILDGIVDKNPTATKSGLTPLHLAAREGQLEFCKIIVKYLMDKNPKNRYGITPLHLAVCNGHLNICRFLIVVASEKNPQDNRGKTPLHHAMDLNHLEISKLISSYLAKDNSQNNGGIKKWMSMKLMSISLYLLGH